RGGGAAGHRAGDRRAVPRRRRSVPRAHRPVRRAARLRLGLTQGVRASAAPVVRTPGARIRPAADASAALRPAAGAPVKACASRWRLLTVEARRSQPWEEPTMSHRVIMVEPAMAPAPEHVREQARQRFQEIAEGLSGILPDSPFWESVRVSRLCL